MTHSNAIADCYGVKFKSGAACLPNSLLDHPANLVQMHVARHYLTKTVSNTDEWFVNVGVAETTGAK